MRVKGRKRILLVDTLGLLLRVIVVSANWSDRELTKPLLYATPYPGTWQRIVVDGGFGSPAAANLSRKVIDIELQVVTRPEVNESKRKGFTPLSCRWVVECTFARLGRYHRFAKDYEVLSTVSETLVTFAFINMLTHRLARVV